MHLCRWLATLAVVIVPSTASAEWVAMKTDDPFEETETHMAMTAAGGTLFGFVCTTKAVAPPLIAFLLPERVDDRDAVKIMNMMGVEIAVIVDREPKTVLKATLEVVEVSGVSRFRVIVRGDDATALARRMAAAKSRIAVAAVMATKTYHPTTFDVSGSRRAIDVVIAKCGIKGTS